jgi:hypothetical protein
MPVYTVHIPSRGLRSETSAFALSGEQTTAGQAALVDAIFVPEGYSRAAFFLGPFWLAWHRLWLELLAWMVVFLVLTIVGGKFIAPFTTFVIGVALEILLGLEANNLRRGRLARRGYRLIDVAAGATRDDAERSFYRRKLDTAFTAPEPAKDVVQPPPLPPDPHAEVLGMFPLPENPR